METYCIACMRHRSEKHFQIWLEDKTKARRCDDCHDSEVVKERMLKINSERKAKEESETQIQINLDKEIESKRSLCVKRRIEEIRDKMLIDDEVGL
jgi:hypothetical protein